MKNKHYQNKILGIFIIFGIFFTAFELYKNFNHTINYIIPNYIADFSDNKKVSGFADNIFVGEVIKNLGGKEEQGMQNTDFLVKVLYNIKGKSDGTISITQEGGYDFFGHLHIVEGTELLKEGGVYLLTSRGENYQILSHPNGYHFLFSNNDVSKENRNTSILENKIVQEFREAYKNEVYFENDYKISSEKNAYKNLSETEKEEFENIENHFIQ